LRPFGDLALEKLSEALRRTADVTISNKASTPASDLDLIYRIPWRIIETVPLPSGIMLLQAVCPQ